MKLVMEISGTNEALEAEKVQLLTLTEDLKTQLAAKDE